MPRQVWIIAAVLSAATILGIMALALSRRGDEIERLKNAIAQAQADAAKAGDALTAATNRIAEAEEKIAHLVEEKTEAVQSKQGIEDEMRRALESKDVTISELKGRLTVNILDRILFDSGEAELKPEGQRILEKIAGVLAQHTNRQIHVIGHTDDVPIRRKFASNWELSSARAIAAVRFLQEHAGVSPRRLGALGYGEFHPIAPNTSNEGRARNRRIEVVILPEELGAVPK